MCHLFRYLKNATIPCLSHLFSSLNKPRSYWLKSIYNQVLFQDLFHKYDYQDSIPTLHPNPSIRIFLFPKWRTLLLFALKFILFQHIFSNLLGFFVFWSISYLAQFCIIWRSDMQPPPPIHPNYWWMTTETQHPLKSLSNMISTTDEHLSTIFKPTKYLLVISSSPYIRRNTETVLCEASFFIHLA